MTGPILLTGGTGFLGRPILDRLAAPGGPPLRLLWHERPPAETLPERVQLVRGDLARPETLDDACDRVETVVHLATYVGDDEERCDVVNGRGTEALVERARAAGVRRILYVSSAAVYGWAVHRGAKETEVEVRPATPISRSRARAECAVLAAGGIVLRPLFVYGEGDTRFVPVLLRSFERLPFLIDGGRARISVIAVEDLAGVVAAFATGGWSPDHRGVFHIDDGHPPSVREIAEALSRCVGTPVPARSLPLFFARAVIGISGRGLFHDVSRRSLTHRVFLASRDHFYDSSRLWALLGIRAGPPLVEQLPRYVDWYRPFTRAGRSETGP